MLCACANILFLCVWGGCWLGMCSCKIDIYVYIQIDIYVYIRDSIVYICMYVCMYVCMYICVCECECWVNDDGCVFMYNL